MLHDAHIHIKNEEIVNEIKKANIMCIANAEDPEQYAYLKLIQKQYDKLYISAGIHPWNVETMSLQSMEDVLKDAKIIGEIGLDNVWCTCDAELQKQAFEAQLAYAYKTKKPVILHIKGREQEALKFIKKYPNCYLVHWYSCNDHLLDYISLDCYFTIGPSVTGDEAVQQVATLAPYDRILIETDGIDAVDWCDGYHHPTEDYISILERSVLQIASLRNRGKEEILQQLQENFQRFISDIHI